MKCPHCGKEMDSKMSPKMKMKHEKGETKKVKLQEKKKYKRS